MRAPGITPMHNGIANAQSMWPSTACVIVPGTAKMPTHASEVATVSFSGIPSHAENAGTIKMPPPIPSSPQRPPAARPMIASRQRSKCSSRSTSTTADGNAVR